MVLFIRLAVVAQFAAVLDYVSGAALIAERMPEKAAFRGAAGNRFLNFITTPLTGNMRYTAYKGDGTMNDGWPARSQWLDFRTLWFINQQTHINKICDNSAEESAGVYKAIYAAAQSTGVDPRFILAVIMNESRGCVRVQTTSLAVSNPGLMQSYQGKGSCSDPAPLKPCPYTQIEQMVMDGTGPNEAGVNLSDLLKRSNATDVSQYYVAARMYNSGPNSIGSDKELSVGGANSCYAADIANRLLGYVGDSCGPPPPTTDHAAAAAAPAWGEPSSVPNWDSATAATAAAPPPPPTVWWTPEPQTGNAWWTPVPPGAQPTWW